MPEVFRWLDKKTDTWKTWFILEEDAAIIKEELTQAERKLQGMPPDMLEEDVPTDVESTDDESCGSHKI